MSTTITVASYNIHHGIGVDGRLDLQRTADVIRRRDADVVGLQEVDRAYRSRSEFVDQLDVLSETLGMETAFGPAMERSTDRGPDDRPGQYGVALMSEHPIRDATVVSLPSPSDSEPRVLLQGTVDLTDGPAIHVSTTHLGLTRSVRSRQAASIADAVSGSEPSVLVGDFNDPPGSPPIATVTDQMTDALERAGCGDHPTFPSPYVEPGPVDLGGRQTDYEVSVPWDRIDYVFTSSDLGVRDADVVESLASDHSVVVADLTIPST
jgi:endonuclease/exonuclease/phosphatase family metal-dependent hydrolase